MGEAVDYTGMLRRSWPAIVATGLIAFAIAVGVSMALPKSYESEARVLISEADSGVNVFGSEITGLDTQKENPVQTQAELLRSPSQLQAVIARLGLPETPASLAKRVTIAPVGQTSVISVKARAADPRTAARVANAVADEYVTRFRSMKQASLKAAADAVARQITKARDELRAMDAAAARGGMSPAQATERQIASDKLASLADKYEQLQVNAQVEQAAGTVIDRAIETGSPIGPSPLSSGAAGLAAGLLASCAAVVFRGSRASQTREPEPGSGPDPAAADLAQIRALPETDSDPEDTRRGGGDRRTGPGTPPPTGDRRGGRPDRRRGDRRRGGVDRRVARDPDELPLTPQDRQEIDAFWSALGVTPGDESARSGSPAEGADADRG